MNPMFYFLLALTIALAATTNAYGAVLDVNGIPIFGGSYYVLPVIFGAAGGGLNLTPSAGIPFTCSFNIVQESSEVERGIPVKFSNWRPKVAFVPESQNLNIEMDVKGTICVQSTYWSVGEFDGESKQWFVAAGPKPEGDSSRSFFQIKKTGDFPNGYKIAFCPNGNDCIDVGIFVDKYGVRRLALSSTPFPVVFVKATETETLSKTMSII
ncbi:unnamed protein product [Thlaspi arvense]|uniref:Uncharacterized protein n=1 Tax=Thlaspi arvense TaxID=13288 RepID=A0AAU9SN16_THLAR|nr:unnamed protein product [Thlaspi arvense]